MAFAADGDASEATQFGYGTRIGIVLISEAFGLSLLAVLCLLGYISYYANKTSGGLRQYWASATHIHYYFFSLLITECVQAVGGIMSIRWAAEGHVVEGSFCSAQGALKQMGDVGNALAYAIVINTFAIIVFKWEPPASSWLPITVLSGIWLFLVLIVGTNIGLHGAGSYYGNTGDWCWISHAWPVQRIALEYFWMWFAALLNIVLYAAIALALRGTLVVRGWRPRVPAPHERAHLRLNMRTRDDKSSGALASQMLFYPAVYTVSVLPIAITRWDAFVHGDARVPAWATVLSEVIFASSGLANVVLFALTRPSLVPPRTCSCARSHPERPPSGAIRASGSAPSSPDTLGPGARARAFAFAIPPDDVDIELAESPEHDAWFDDRDPDKDAPLDIMIPPHPTLPPPPPRALRESVRWSRATRTP